MSETMAFPKGYFVHIENPILECLVDQMNHDQQRLGEKMTDSRLLNEIIKALSEGIIDWPKGNTIIDRKEWTRLMRIDPIFYSHASRTAKEMFQHECILLELASKYLKRRIILIPFLEDLEDFQFGPRNSETLTSYYLLCCVNVRTGNFYISIFPEKNIECTRQ